MFAVIQLKPFLQQEMDQQQNKMHSVKINHGPVKTACQDKIKGNISVTTSTFVILVKKL